MHSTQRREREQGRGKASMSHWSNFAGPHIANGNNLTHQLAGDEINSKDFQ